MWMTNICLLNNQMTMLGGNLTAVWRMKNCSKMSEYKSVLEKKQN